MEKLSKYLPISEIKEDYWISSYDTITFGYKIEFPEAYTIGENEYNQLTDTLFNSFNRLGKNVIIQKYGMFYEYEWRSTYNSESPTKLWNDMHYDKREVMDVDHFIFISFYFGNANLASSSNKYSGKHLKHIVDRKFQNIKGDKISEYQELLSSFEVSLGFTDGKSSNPLFPSVEKLTSNDMLAFLERYLSVDYLPDKSVYDYASYDFRDGFNVGAKDVSIFSMRYMPDTFNPFTKSNGLVQNPTKYNKGEDYFNDLKLPSSFLFPLGMGLPIEHLICETFILLDYEKVEGVLEKELQEIKFLVGLGRSDAINKRDVLQEFIVETAKNDYTTCKYGLTIIVPHLKEKRIEFSTSIIDIAAAKGLKLYRENRGDLKTFMFNLPGSGHLLSDLKIGWLDSYIKTIHYEGYKNGNNIGIPFVDVFGKPFLFDFWDEKEKYLNARNGVLFAPTGGGKSFLINHMLDSCFNQGDDIFIIDVGASYIRTTEINNGLYYDSNDITTFRFNPFLSCFRNNKGEYFPSRNTLGEEDPMFRNFLISIIISLWYFTGKDKNALANFKLEDGVYSTIQSSINGFYEYINKEKITPSFDAYYYYIKDVYSKIIKENNDERFFDVQLFLKNTESFTKAGEYSFLLNAYEPIDLSNRWVCFELDKIKDNNFIKSPVMLILMNAFQNKLDSKERGRMRFFIDEAVDFLDLPMFGTFIGELYRKIRKKGGQIVICTQSIRYLDNIDPLIANSIYSNSPIRILLDHSNDQEAIPILQQKLSLSDSETELIRNLKVDESRPFRYFFMKFGNMPGFIARNEVSERTFMAYQTNAQYINEIDRIKERTGSLYSAIETFVTNRKVN